MLTQNLEEPRVPSYSYSRYLVTATTNARHFQGFAEALNWQDINL
ncbi:hypothetical protein [Microcystis aeruginosa]|nr:hypothetical protein [Microcystis aeruginosa]